MKVDFHAAISQRPSEKPSRTYRVCVFFIWVEALRPNQHFSVMSGRSHRALGITSTFWEVNVSCSRIHYGDPRNMTCCIWSLNIGLTVFMSFICDPMQDVDVKLEKTFSNVV